LSSILAVKQIEQGNEAWARATFGHAELGDRRRTERLVSMATQAAVRPHGHLNETFVEDLNVSYDFIENDAVRPSAMISAMGEATARAASKETCVYVATDGSSVAITDNDGTKGTGRIGSDDNGGRGDKIHSALCLSSRGELLGLLDIQFWQRTGPSKKKRVASLPTSEKETQRWMDARQHAREVLAKHAPNTRPHFLHDREADCWPVLKDAFEHRATEDTTVRSSWNRILVPETEGEDHRSFLRDAVAAASAKGTYELDVPAGPKRKARKAKLELRAGDVTLRLRNKKTQEIMAVRIGFVQALERGTVPANEKPIEWLLLTTKIIQTFDDALSIVRAYALRWRIEEFHRAFKGGGTEAEDTQTVGENRTRWLIILAAVAARAVRLSYLSKIDPECDPRCEFSNDEIEAVGRWLARRKKKVDVALTMSAMVRTIANLGGYVPQKSNPNPGPQTIVRGLRRLADFVDGARLAHLANDG
jgi:hypothetical protein